MDIRKIAVAGTFAAGAALAFAPMASADAPAAVDPILVDSTLGSEQALLNSIFVTDASLAGVTPDQYSLVDGFEVVNPADVTDVQGTAGHLTPFDYLIYGVNPTEAGLASDPGSYNVLNGALTQFDNAYNVELYSLFNGGALDTNPADYIDNNAVDHALTLGNTTEAASYLFNFGVGDLAGYVGIFPPAAATAAADPAAVDITPILTNEIESMNSMFGLDASLAGIPATDIIQGTGPLPWDTISPDNTNAVFNALVFGLNPANVTDDPGSYNLFNGALTEFDNAYNIGLFSLLNPGDTFPVADVFGSHADFLAGGPGTAIGDFLQLGLSDLLGYFTPALG